MNVWVAGPSDRPLLIAQGTGKYQQDLDETARADNVTERQALADHRAWLQVIVPPWHPATEKEAARIALRAAAALADQDVLALYLADDIRLVALDAAARASLAADDAAAQLGKRGASIALWPQEEAGNEPADRDAWRLGRFSEKLKSAAPGKRAVVRIEIQIGRVKEAVWLAIDRMVRLQYGTRYEARLLNDSQLVPHLRQGERVSIWDDDVLEFRFEDVQLITRESSGANCPPRRSGDSCGRCAGT